MLVGLAAVAGGAHWQAQRSNEAVQPGWYEYSGPPRQAVQTPLLSVRRVPEWLIAPTSGARLSKAFSTAIERPETPARTCLVVYLNDEPAFQHLGDELLVPALASQDSHRVGLLGGGGRRPPLHHPHGHKRRRPGRRRGRSPQRRRLPGGRRRSGAVDAGLHGALSRGAGSHGHNRSGRIDSSRPGGIGDQRHKGQGDGRRVPLPRSRAGLCRCADSRRRRPHMETVFRDETTRWGTVRAAPQRRLRVLPVRSQPAGRRQNKRAGDPALHAASLFDDLLEERGFRIRRSPGKGEAPEERHVLASVDSPSANEIVARMLRHSDNTTAEMLFKEIGKQAGVGRPGPRPSWRRTTRCSRSSTCRPSRPVGW